MSYNPQNPNGSNSQGNSAPVVLSNDYYSTTLAKVTDGTNTANVVAGDSGFNGVAIAGAVKTIPFTTSTPGVQVIGPYQIEGYTWIEINYSSIGSGLTLTGGQFAPTSGGVYFTSTSWGATLTASLNGSLGTTVNTTYASPIRGNYFQIAVSALTSGTFSGTIVLRTTAPPSVTTFAAQSGTWTVGSNSATGSAVPANAFLTGVSDGTDLRAIVQPSVANNTSGTGIAATANMVQYQSSAPTVTSGDYYVAQADVAGNTKVYLATKIDPTNDGITTYPFGHSYNYISTATTTTVKASSGVLNTIIVSGGTAGTIIVYDNTAASGTIIASFSSTNAIASYDFQVAFSTGLTIITSAATQLTVSYR